MGKYVASVSGRAALSVAPSPRPMPNIGRMRYMTSSPTTGVPLLSALALSYICAPMYVVTVNGRGPVSRPSTGCITVSSWAPAAVALARPHHSPSANRRISVTELEGERLRVGQRVVVGDRPVEREPPLHHREGQSESAREA